jgi:hypothetical protein
MINDMYFVRPGEHGILARWHGAPWPLALLLAVPLAHLWLLLLVWLACVKEWARGRWVLMLMIALGISIAVFHGFIWDNGSWVRHRFSS